MEANMKTKCQLLLGKIETNVRQHGDSMETLCRHAGDKLETHMETKPGDKHGDNSGDRWSLHEDKMCTFTR